MKEFEFAIVCHGGPLEAQAMLCLKSLLTYQTSIHGIKAFYPRQLPEISDAGRCFFGNHNIELIEFDNPFLTSGRDCQFQVEKASLLANKIWCLQELTTDVPRIFLDCDILILSDLSDVLRNISADIAVSPTFLETFGLHQDELFRQLRIPIPEQRITTVLSGESIIPYFNSGFVMARGTRKLSETWRDIYQTLREKDGTGLIDSAYFAEQISLSLAIHKNGYRVQLWPHSVNVPLGFLNYRNGMKAVHWFNFEVLRQQTSMIRPFRKAITPLIESLYDEDGIDLRRLVLRPPADLSRIALHRARELVRRTNWRLSRLSNELTRSRSRMAKEAI